MKDKDLENFGIFCEIIKVTGDLRKGANMEKIFGENNYEKMS